MLEKKYLFLNPKENLEIQFSNFSMKNEDSFKLAGIHINKNLNVDYHVNQLCKKASKNFML